MNEKLIEYIQKRLELGHDIEAIKTTLQNAGHDFADVEQHLNHTLNLRAMEEKMKKFVKKHIEKGVHKDRIRGYLVNAGYKEEMVDRNIKHALKNKKNKQIIKLSIGIAILLASVFLLYIGIGAELGNLFDNGASDYESNPSRTNTQEFTGERSANEECGQACKDKQTLDKALISRNVQLCDEIEDAATQDWCKQFFKR